MDVQYPLQPFSLDQLSKASNRNKRKGVPQASLLQLCRLQRYFVLFLLFFALLIAGPAVSSAAEIQSGHSAFWYDAARDGEGWVLEILPDDRALLYWFTYDEEGNQRWLQAVGKITDGEEDPAIEFPELYVTRGAEFGSDFDPSDVEREVVGFAAMTFEDCDQGTFSYTAFGQSQTIEMTRLTQTMAAGCQPINGVPGQPVKEYAGQSGSWFDTAHDGEGFALQWLSRDEAVVTWYSYDTEGNQYWMIGVGQYQDGQIVFPELQSTRGARFGEAFDPEDVERFSWGSLTMDLQCSAGSAQYDSQLADFGSGDFDLNRLTQLKRPDCPYVQPKLQDLYEITWNEIPIDRDTKVQADAIANNGTIAARGPGPNGEDGWHLRLWRPETGEWKIVSRKISAELLFISPDGDTVVSSEPGSASRDRRNPLIWRESTGWDLFEGIIYEASVVYGASQDLSYVIGRGFLEGESHAVPWIWSPDNGQQQLPLTDEIGNAIPGAASNDGATVAGVTLRVSPDGSPFPVNYAVIWENGHEPKLMRDERGIVLSTPTACDRRCGTVFGFGHAEANTNHPHAGEPWFWKPSGLVGYLGTVPDAVGGARPYVLADVSADGRLAVGSYSAGSGNSRAYIWTQRTGMVSVRALSAEMGLGDDAWEDQIAVSVSPNGKRILLRGYAPTSVGSKPWRAVELALKAK